MVMSAASSGVMLGSKGMQLLIGVVLAQGQPQGLGLCQILRAAGVAVRVALTGGTALGTAEDLLLLHLIVAAHHDGEDPIVRQALLDGVTGDDLLQGVIIAQEPDIQLSARAVPSSLSPSTVMTRSNRLISSSTEGLMSMLMAEVGVK